MNAASEYTQPIQLHPFRQDVATFYTDLDGLPSRNVCAIACTTGGAIYAGTAAGLARFAPETNRWEPFEVDGLAKTPVLRLFPDHTGGLYIGLLQDLCQFALDRASLTRKFTGSTVLALAEGATSGRDLLLLSDHRFIDSANARVIALPDGATGRALALLSDGTPLLATDRGLLCYHEGQLRPISPDSADANVPGQLLDPDVRDLAADSRNGLWAATARGLNYYTQNTWLEITGENGLPVLDLRCLALGEDGALWIGSACGVIRLLEGRWRYYAGRRWLPSDAVNAIAIDTEGSAWIATERGIARIAFPRMTFVEKAAHYEQITAQRHNRDGYVTDCRLTPSGDYTGFVYEASDNDGLWTALYLCAESFRYAVTRDSEARALAAKSLHALRELVRVTGIPGFPARALLRRGERVIQSDPGPNWYPSPVEPDILYKNDTSSDEVDGHYLAWYVYSELVADADEKAAIAATCRAVTNHILDHDYTLVGPTGKRTRWGVWPPESLNRDPDWAEERGLNSLEILSHLKVAIHLCGDARFREAYRDLGEREHYALNTILQKRLPPTGENNHSDDELAACAYYPLLQLERDPTLRSLYLLSLERTQAILRPERSPFHNVIYGTCTGQPCDAEAAAQWLRDAPWDLRTWGMNNSQRADVTLDPFPGRHGERQLTHVLPPGETRVAKWNHNPYAADRPGDGSGEEDGTFWLLPYWMGRYHGIFT